MGIAKFVRTKILEPIFGSKIAAQVTDFLVAQEQQAIAVLATTEFGAVVKKAMDDLDAATNADRSVMTGEQKAAKVLADLLPLFITFLTQKGAVNLVEQEVMDTLKALIQVVYNNAKSTTAGALAGQILALFGVKA